MIQACVDPSAPILACHTTKVYGAPIRTPGRVPPLSTTPTPIEGIVLHCLRDSFDGYLNKACRASPSLMECQHGSMHYVIDGASGRISCLVKETDVAWAFQSYLSNFPLPNPTEGYPGWPTLANQYPTLSADFYTINIGITVPPQTQVETLDGGEDCCTGPYGMTWEAYHNLIHLLAWIAHRLGIVIDTQHIALHDQIVARNLGCEECVCANLNCLICDISNYCEGCRNAADPRFLPSPEIAYVYGETADGCMVKISIADLKTQLGV